MQTLGTHISVKKFFLLVCIIFVFGRLYYTNKKIPKKSCQLPFKLGLCDNAKCYITKTFFISNKILHILFYKRLLARNVSLFTFSGKRHDLFTLTILPVQLKALSEGTDVEGMQRYFRAKLAI